MLALEGKNVLISGASSGIGAALAREFFGKGANLLLIAWREQRLKDLAAQLDSSGTRIITQFCDVTVDGEIEQAIAHMRERFGPLNIAVANAGFGIGGRVDALSIDDFRRQFETNVFGVLRTIYAAMGDLKQTRGGIAIIGSINGYISLPGTAAYCMSKFAIRALAESLFAELRPHGVAVTHIVHGYVRSEIRQVDQFGVHDPQSQASGPRLLEVSAERAAREMCRAIIRRRREAVITGHGNVAVW